MSAGKRILTGIITVAVIGGIGAGGWFAYKKLGGGLSASNEKVYVQKVSAVNTVTTGDLFSNSFAGVIEAQKSVNVKYDTTKTVDEVLVQNGDRVSKGDKVLTYDVEAIQLEIETAKLEVERLENTIKSNEDEIKSLEDEKKKVSEDVAVSYTTQILSLQSDNARSEYDIKAKNVEIQKLEASLDNAFVTAPLDGTVSDVKTPSSGSEYDYSENADVIMKITADGNYRVKGIFNEQNAPQIYQGAPVILRSRVDDTARKGTISEIDTNPQSSNDDHGYYDGESDGQSTSSKYAFYVEPEDLEGFMLGQHLLIELDNGQDAVTKTGVWLYNDFILKDGDKAYVWAKTDKDTIEKRYVELGQTDEANGDTEIVSGLANSDYIAYPASYIKEGMKTTTNQSDVSVAENDFGEGGLMGEDEYYEEYGDEGEGDMETFTDDNGYTYNSSDDGGMTITDEDGKVYTMDPETGIMADEDGNQYMFDTEGLLVPYDEDKMAEMWGEEDFGEGEGELPDDMEVPEDKEEVTESQPDLTFEDIYGISEEELSAMTDEEREAFFKSYYGD